jgi:UDP-2,4-diacetamido-2,4,6-trideoxy-beta-L-altropyranose hydrolase
MNEPSRESSMRILIRADASASIGTGHLARCLALAESFRARDGDVTFATRPMPPELSRMVLGAGCRLVNVMPDSWAAKSGAWEQVLPSPDQQSDAAATRGAVPKGEFDWLIVDHYGLDARWECEMRDHAQRIMVIDDLVNRAHSCELLLDQNLGEDREARHRALSGPGPRYLVGPRYALLRPGFAAARARSGPRQGRVERILVMYGGADPTDETTKAVQALRQLPGVATSIDVVAGMGNSRSEAIRSECARDPRMRLHLGATNIPQLMAAADLALGACGSSAWERCTLYLPTLAVIVADNQREIADSLAAARAAEVVGWHAEVSAEVLAAAVARMAGSPGRLRALSVAAGALADGLGVNRVSEAMEQVHAHPRVLH